MLIGDVKKENHVEFVSYTGKYPNLCSGVLTLNIDGITHTFGPQNKTPKPEFESFWHSGGSCGFAGKSPYTNHGEWKIDVEDIPEQFRDYAAEIDEVFNGNVEYGCCGGCL